MTSKNNLIKLSQCSVCRILAKQEDIKIIVCNGDLTNTVSYDDIHKLLGYINEFFNVLKSS